MPLFKVEADSAPPDNVLKFKKSISLSEAVIISTPEYIHNIPAILKNALEWTTSSGEFYQKKILAITCTPHPPRGEKAMLSLNNSLVALDAQVVATLALYQNEIFIEDNIDPRAESFAMLKEALKLL